MNSNLQPNLGNIDIPPISKEAAQDVDEINVEQVDDIEQRLLESMAYEEKSPIR
jgi:hypothetical protein